MTDLRTLIQSDPERARKNQIGHVGRTCQAKFGEGGESMSKNNEKECRR